MRAPPDRPKRPHRPRPVRRSSEDVARCRAWARRSLSCRVWASAIQAAAVRQRTRGGHRAVGFRKPTQRSRREAAQAKGSRPEPSPPASLELREKRVFTDCFQPKGSQRTEDEFRGRCCRGGDESWQGARKACFGPKRAPLRRGAKRFSTTPADNPVEWQEAVNQLSAIV